MTLIDAHHHVWDLSVRDQPWLAQPELAPLRRNFALSDLEPEATAQGVTATVLVQTVSEPDETLEMLALAAASDLVAGVVGWVDLEAPGAAEAIGGLRQRPGGYLLAGIRHPLLTEPDPDWLARPAVRRGLAAVAAAGLVFDVVCEPGQLPAAAAAAAATPQLTFVLDHLGNRPQPRRRPDVDQRSAPTRRAAEHRSQALGHPGRARPRRNPESGPGRSRAANGAHAAVLRGRAGQLRA
jgi:L-fuconolactonase